MLIHHQSNRLERLMDALEGVIAVPPEAVFAPETVLVQSQGMARWLAMEIARRQGICANLDCPFPAAYAWRLLSQAGDCAEDSPYAPAALAWSIFAILAERGREAVFAPVAAYVEGEDPEARLFGLARQVAQVFDIYLLYRPELLERWSAGDRDEGHARWQAALWRALEERHGPCHRVVLHRRFMEMVDDDFLDRAGVPARLALFGIPALPPALVELFAAVSRSRDVHVFSLVPCREFWFDLVDEKALLRVAATGEAGALHLEQGCRLLVGLGRVGREYQTLLQEIEPQVDEQYFETPSTDTALGRVQADLLDGRPPAPGAGLDADDHSIEIVAAHSPMREVEILADTLRRMLDEEDDLEAGDLLVMTPDIDRYAPLVEAVFGSGEVNLPYAVADRPPVSALELAFFDLLTLAGSRFTAAGVLEFAAREPVRRRFGITDDDLECFRLWIEDSGIRWGLDPEHRAGCGLPTADSADVTWRHGLDRLLLGYALPAPAAAAKMFQGLLPCAAVDAGARERLTALLDLHAALAAFAREASRPRPLAEWQTLLSRTLETFLAADDNGERALKAIRAALDAMGAAAATAVNERPVGLPVVRAALTDALGRTAGGRNFLSGRITFCQLVPMRSIPFAVICLLGMNHGDFPRQDQRPNFDLAAAAPRRGDRSRREDDRYLFLETILSARRRLYLSHVGRSERDNRPQPPAVVVSELLDHLAARHGLTLEAAWRRFVREHPLQPFSGRYFDGTMPSRSRRDYEIARRLGGNIPHPPLAPPASRPWEAPDRVTVGALVSFFLHPVKYYLRSVLGADLEARYALPPERECLEVDQLGRYRLMDAVTGLAEARQRDLVPIGSMGEVEHNDCTAEALAHGRRLDAWRRGDPQPVAIHLDAGGVRVVGELLLYEGRLVLGRPVKEAGVKDLIRMSLFHLLVCAALPDEAPETVFVSREKTLLLEFEAMAASNFATLIDFFKQGHGRPLPFAPESAKSYLTAARKKEHDAALAAARKFYHHGSGSGAYRKAPEADDPYLAAAFGAGSPMEADADGFVLLTKLLIAPALAAKKANDPSVTPHAAP